MARSKERRRRASQGIETTRVQLKLVVDTREAFLKVRQPMCKGGKCTRRRTCYHRASAKVWLLCLAALSYITPLIDNRHNHYSTQHQGQEQQDECRRRRCESTYALAAGHTDDQGVCEEEKDRDVSYRSRPRLHPLGVKEIGFECVSRAIFHS